MNQTNRRAETSLIELVVFIILIVVFTVGIGFYVVYHGSYTAFYEKLLSQEFALVIDAMEPAMDVSIDITRLYNLATKNRYAGEFIFINNSDHTVFVRLNSDSGYSYTFFNDQHIVWNIDGEKRLLLLRSVSFEPEEKISQ